MTKLTEQERAAFDAWYMQYPHLSSSWSEKHVADTQGAYTAGIAFERARIAEKLRDEAQTYDIDSMFRRAYWRYADRIERGQ